MRRMNVAIGIGLVILLGALSAEAVHAAKPRYKEMDLKEVGTIIGVVRFEGKIPKLEKLRIKSDDSICHQEPIFKEDLVVSADKKVRWAVASIKKIREGKPFPKENTDEPVVLNQVGCRFVPHVVVVPQRKTLRILNSDAVLHNVHSVAKKNSSFNKSMPPFVKQLDVSFKRSERIPVKCDVHAWMRAWVIVAEHPYYAVTDTDGTFRFENVPVGTHMIEVWHESLGKQQVQVAVEAGKETRIEITFQKGKRVARR